MCLDEREIVLSAAFTRTHTESRFGAGPSVSSSYCFVLRVNREPLFTGRHINDGHLFKNNRPGNKRVFEFDSFLKHDVHAEYRRSICPFVPDYGKRSTKNTSKSYKKGTLFRKSFFDLSCRFVLLISHRFVLSAITWFENSINNLLEVAG